MKKVIKRSLNIVLIILQLISILGVIILQYLSTRKMGVAQYLSYKNIKFKEQLFRPEFLNIYKIVLIVILIVSIILLFYKLARSKSRKLNKGLIIVPLLSVMGIGFILFTNSMELRGYYFFIIAIFLNIVIQTFRSIALKDR